MSRKSYPGGWSIWKKKGAPKKPWKAENGSGVDRVRFGFSTEQDAIDYVTIAHRLSRDKNKPFLSLPPDDPRWSVIQTLAEKVSVLKFDSTEMDEWQSLIHAKPGTRKTLHLMKGRIDYCLDRHKPEFMVKAVFDKLSSTRSSFTVQQMVEARRKAKAKKNSRVQNDRDKRRTKGNTDQVFEVGETLIKFFGEGTDIDTITPSRMEEWEAHYLKTHLKKDGKSIAGTTMEHRKGIAAGHFKHAALLGWPGVPPCKWEKVPNAHLTVILSFNEAAGVLVALSYIDPRACLAFAIELYGLLRTNESLWVRREDIVLPDNYLQVKVPKLTSDHSKRKMTEFTTETVQIIDALHQWICYHWDKFDDRLWEQVKNADEGQEAFYNCILKAKDAAGVDRWNRKDTGRHTGGSMAYVLGVPLEDIQEQMRHVYGSLVTQDRYLRDMPRRDAAAILLVTPANLGWIPSPYDYTPLASRPNHLGHHLRLTTDREDHRSIMEEYIPKLRAIDARIRAALHIE